MKNLKLPLENYSYAKLISKIIKRCNIHNFKYQIIGFEKFEKINQHYPLYRITINPKKKKKLCIITGTHGDEIAGPLSILESLKNIEKYYFPDIRYDIFPMTNPTEFDLRIRTDDDKKDLNNMSRIISKNRNYNEVNILKKSIKNEKFEILLSLHEDIDTEKFYLYHHEPKPFNLSKHISKNTKKYIPIFSNRTIYKDKID